MNTLIDKKTDSIIMRMSGADVRTAKVEYYKIVGRKSKQVYHLQNIKRKMISEGCSLYCFFIQTEKFDGVAKSDRKVKKGLRLVRFSTIKKKKVATFYYNDFEFQNALGGAPLKYDKYSVFPKPVDIQSVTERSEENHDKYFDASEQPYTQKKLAS